MINYTYLAKLKKELNSLRTIEEVKQYQIRFDLETYDRIYSFENNRHRKEIENKIKLLEECEKKYAPYLNKWKNQNTQKGNMPNRASTSTEPSKTKEEIHYDKLIKNMGIWNSENEFVEFMTWLKSHWIHYAGNFSKWTDEQVKEYVTITNEWIKLDNHQHIETICIQCIFRHKHLCGQFKEYKSSFPKQYPIPIGQYCNTFRTAILPSEEISGDGCVSTKNNRMDVIGFVPYKYGGLILTDGHSLKPNEGIDENGIIRELEKDEFRMQTGKICKHIPLRY